MEHSWDVNESHVNKEKINLGKREKIVGINDEHKTHAIMIILMDITFSSV